jgi:hypothetical protein
MLWNPFEDLSQGHAFLQASLAAHLESPKSVTVKHNESRRQGGFNLPTRKKLRNFVHIFVCRFMVPEPSPEILAFRPCQKLGKKL